MSKCYQSTHKEREHYGLIVFKRTVNKLLLFKNVPPSVTIFINHQVRLRPNIRLFETKSYFEETKTNMELTVMIQSCFSCSQTKLSSLRSSIDSTDLTHRQLVSLEYQLAHLARNYSLVAILKPRSIVVIRYVYYGLGQ